jgi:hypothetical protein
LTVRGSLIAESLVVRSDLRVEGGLTVANRFSAGSSVAGEVTLVAGETEVFVSFEEEYDSIPYVQVTSDDYLGNFTVSERARDGFTIKISEPRDGDTIFQWFAIEPMND